MSVNWAILLLILRKNNMNNFKPDYELPFKDKLLTIRDNELKNMQKELADKLSRNNKIYKHILYNAYHKKG